MRIILLFLALAGCTRSYVALDRPPDAGDDAGTEDAGHAADADSAIACMPTFVDHRIVPYDDSTYLYFSLASRDGSTALAHISGPQIGDSRDPNFVYMDDTTEDPYEESKVVGVFNFDREYRVYASIPPGG